MQSKQHQGLVHRNYIQRLELGDYFCIARVFNKYFIVIIYSIVVRTPIVKRIRKLWPWWWGIGGQVTSQPVVSRYLLFYLACATTSSLLGEHPAAAIALSAAATRGH